MQLVLGGIKVWLFFLVLGVTPGLGHREVLQTTSLRRSNGGYLLSRDDAAKSAQGAGMKYEAEEKEPKKKPGEVAPKKNPLWEKEEALPFPSVSNGSVSSGLNLWWSALMDPAEAPQFMVGRPG